MSGIPQGSILGPILFTIFINDLPNWVSSCCKIFVDDTKLYDVASNNVQIQTDIDALQRWSDKWNLYLDTDKCKVMHIGLKGGLYTLLVLSPACECRPTSGSHCRSFTTVRQPPSSLRCHVLGSL